MKKLFIFVLVAGLLFYGYSKYTGGLRGAALEVERTFDEITITSGDNQVVFEEGEFIDEDYRIFSVNLEKQKDSPLNHITAYLSITSLDYTREVWERDDCEDKALGRSKLMPIVVSDEEVRAELIKLLKSRDKYEHFALRMRGSMIHEKEHSFGGEPLRTVGGNLNVTQCILLSEVALAEW